MKLFRKNHLINYLIKFIYKRYKYAVSCEKKMHFGDCTNIHNYSRKFVDPLPRRLYQKLIINQTQESIMR